MKQEQPDYYAQLGISRDATPDEIRRAYHRAARLIHPDMNSASGATEAFLQLQTAFEVLSDVRKKAIYDKSRPKESQPSEFAVMAVSYSRNNLIVLSEKQLIYALVELSAPAEARLRPSPPLNLSLVIDRSTSMQGERMDTVKRSAIELLHHLKNHDVFSIVTFSDRSEILLPPTLAEDIKAIEAKIKLIQTGGGTEILHGLETGLGCVRNRLSRDYSNHVILLTDGRTYGDEAACLTLAEEASREGIIISGMGIGEAWNDEFLDELVSRTGGSSAYISSPRDINSFLTEKIKDLGQSYADRVRLDLNLSPDVELRDVFRLSPTSQPLSIVSPIHVGAIPKSTELSILLEFLLPPLDSPETDHPIAQGSVHFDVPVLLNPEKTLPIRFSRPVTANKTIPPPPTRMLQAISRITMYRMQDKARAYLDEGHLEYASRYLQHLATHLFSNGEHSLARAVLQEANNISEQQNISETGKKHIKYATRALLLPSGRTETAGVIGGQR